MMMTTAKTTTTTTTSTVKKKCNNRVLNFRRCMYSLAAAVCENYLRDRDIYFEIVFSDELNVGWLVGFGSVSGSS